MRAAVILAATLILPAIAFSSTIIVPDDYGTIQAAIGVALGGDTVLVKPGTYLENIDFKGKAITVMSEQGEDVSVIDGSQAGSVVNCQSGEDEHSILDGFTIINGHADYGGGMYVKQSSPTVTHCTFSSNSAVHGGGMYTLYSNSTITHCTFSRNSAHKYNGGGMCNWDSEPKVTNCIFIENWGQYYGGGMFNAFGAPPVTNCTFFGNEASEGGGMYNGECDPTVTNCIFSGNSAVNKGGGMFNGDNGPSPTITNCTFFGNEASEGGGIHNQYSSPTVTNSILWEDSPDEINNYYCLPSITYSCIQGGYPGIGNVNADPLFIDPVNGDCHLTYHSPCKDTGNNAAAGLPIEDFEGDPRIAYNRVDMGADEFHTHLYYLGDTTPGGYVIVKIIGHPGPKHIVLYAGSGVLDPFCPTQYGNWYLQLPIVTLRVFKGIPDDGIVFLSSHIPPDFPSWDIPLQTIVGKELTNLCIMVVK